MLPFFTLIAANEVCKFFIKLLQIGNNQNNLEEAWQQPDLRLVCEKSVCAP